MDPQNLSTPSRRAFLKSSAVSALPFAAPFIARAQSAEPTLKVGLIGCGGRGSGAAMQAMNADQHVKLWSMGDAFESQLEGALGRFQAGKAGEEGKIEVAPERRFVGLDAFKKVLESDVDVVILATPPGFRPQHVRAAIEAGKHVFCEKPMAVDVPGLRSVIESAKMAKEKKLSLVSGFCWRYCTSRREAMTRVLEGQIGDISSYYATYYTGPVKPMPPSTARPKDMADVEWQVRNWYNFSWLGGDSLVEQAVHSIDKISWAMGDQPPIAVVGSGGRQLPNHDGNIFDHFNITYEYPNGVLAFLGSRQIPNCFNENADYILGTKGRCEIGRGNPSIVGEKSWRFRGEDNDMYQAEHDALFKSIRQSEPRNDGDWMTTSTMLALAGRMAAYSGRRIEWKEAIESALDLAPDDLKFSDNFDPGPIPMPGVTSVS